MGHQCWTSKTSQSVVECGILATRSSKLENSARRTNDQDSEGEHQFELLEGRNFSNFTG